MSTKYLAFLIAIVTCTDLTLTVMKKMILPPAISVVILLVATCGFAQDYDLIVTTNGDSIACRIDSITESHIYFEMKSQNKWVHTNIEKEKVSEYKQNAIDKKLYNFKSGTSIITSLKPAIPASMYHVRKNSVYIGMLSINYARMIPLSQTSGITLGGGLIMFYTQWGVVAESSVLLGDTRHFFEPGIMGFYFFVDRNIPDTNAVGSAVSLRIGYRYQATGGLLFRAAANLIFVDQDIVLYPALSLGYSF
jgi:hypothetical protein